jgi:hypothetical protein
LTDVKGPAYHFIPDAFWHTLVLIPCRAWKAGSPPRVTAIEYLDHCTQMADRFNRMYLRVLRQMRDLRRYSVPVTINNPKQVNIAADGGQQVNVQNKSGVKSRKRKKASDKPQAILKAAK